VADARTPPGGGAEKRARIIAQQALREAAAGPVGWTASRKRRSRPNWTSGPGAHRSAPDRDARPDPEPAAQAEADVDDPPASKEATKK
jgi:hypothetical protein